MFFLVNHAKKFIIGWSAKAGCCAIKQWYVETSDIDLGNRDIHEYLGYGNTEYSNVKDLRGQAFDNYRKFICIRNPYKRLVSAYVNKYIIEKAYPVKGWKNFEEFVDILQKDTNFRKINRHHFIRQTAEDFRIAERNQWEWDKVIELDSFREDMRVVNAMLSVDTKIPGKINFSNYSGATDFDIPVYRMSASEIETHMPQCRYFYNSRIRDRVSEIYNNDFEYFSRYGIRYEVP